MFKGTNTETSQKNVAKILRLLSQAEEKQREKTMLRDQMIDIVHHYNDTDNGNDCSRVVSGIMLDFFNVEIKRLEKEIKILDVERKKDWGWLTNGHRTDKPYNRLQRRQLQQITLEE